MVFITFSSLYTFEDTNVPDLQIPHLDKLVHFVFYFVAAVLGYFSFRNLIGSRASISRIRMGLLLFLIIFGIIIEVIQHRYTMTRAGDVFDALANAIGALVGLWMAKTLFSFKKRLNWK